MDGRELSSEKFLILKAALGHDETAARARERWNVDDYLDTIEGSCHGLLPLLHRDLARHAVDHPDLPRLGGVRRFWWTRNRRLLWRLGKALTPGRR